MTVGTTGTALGMAVLRLYAELETSSPRADSEEYWGQKNRDEKEEAGVAHGNDCSGGSEGTTSMLLTMRVVVAAPISASYHAAAAGSNTRGAPVTTVVTAACAPQPAVNTSNQRCSWALLAAQAAVSLHNVGVTAVARHEWAGAHVGEDGLGPGAAERGHGRAQAVPGAQDPAAGPCS